MEIGTLVQACNPDVDDCVQVNVQPALQEAGLLAAKEVIREW